MATVAEILLERARQQGEARRQQGQIAGQTWSNLANIIAGTGKQIEQERVQAPIRAQEAELRTQQIEGAKARTAAENLKLKQDTDLGTLLSAGQTPTLSQLVTAGGVERGLAIAQGMRALNQASDNDVHELARGLSALPEEARAQYYPTARQVLIGRGRVDAKDLPETYDPKWWATTVGEVGKPLSEKDKADIAKTQAETKKIEAETAGTLPQTAQQKEVERHNREMERIGVMGAGRAEAAQAETARHNRAMEENAKNTKTARPLTSGDANKIADYDTSLNDLTTLRGAVKDPGTISRIQSALPTWVSEITGGWTDDAKQQNAVIARVRQVIGKALEGGVLRKEDEEKYKQILPVIGDSKAVALNKIEGLEKALVQRRDTQLSALEDAGYDVSKYRTRDAAKPPTTLPTVGSTFQGGKVLKIEKIQ